jgi:hypothetical protein
MRIEQVISQYGSQEFGRHAQKKGAERTMFGSRRATRGCVDMLSLSPDSIDPLSGLTDLIGFARLIPDDTAKEWVRSSFFRQGFDENGLIDKLIIEIL